MIQWHIGHHTYRHYVENGEGFVTGTAFLGNRMLQGEALLNHVLAWESAEELKEGLQNLNGFFAVFANRGTHAFAAVDRLRSIPLFYGKRESDVFISDDARWVRDQVEDRDLDSMAKQEFLATGYVTGSDTLFPKVKQIQAGEFVVFQTDGEGNSGTLPQRYFRYVHSNYSDSSEEILHLRLQETLEEIFGRLIALANGRPIVVPLSGGYDSRLIVLMLKKLNYENVIAFSYGKPGNKESEVSKEVATALGFRWEFVPYTNELWYRWYRSDEMRDYLHFANGLSSLPHIQDWPAVLTLKRENRLPADSIFIPGHSADLPAGSRSRSVPDLYLKNVKESRLIKAILSYHYNLFPWRKDPLEEVFKNRIKRTLRDFSQYPDPASAFESWDISERQPKFIINSLRVYDFFGYEWWIPFWDYSFIEFWCHIKPMHRINQSIYLTTLTAISLFHKLPKRLLPVETHETQNMSIKKLAKRFLPLHIQHFITSRKHLKKFKNHALQWYGIHEDSHIIEQIKKGATNINSIIASDFLVF